VDALQAADPDVDLQPVLARAGTSTLLALGLGTLLGSLLPYLFDRLPADGTAVLTPLSMPILLAIGAHLLLLAATLLLVHEEPVAARAAGWRQGFGRVPAITRTGFALSRRNPTILLLLGATLAGGLALSGLESFWQPYFAGLLGGSRGNSLFFGVVMGGNFLLGMAGNLLATPLSRLLGKRYGLVCALFQGLWGLSIVLLAQQNSPVPAVLFFWLAYMNMGGANSPHSTLLNREIPAEQRSIMLSIASLTGYVGGALGSVVLGYVAEHLSISAAWLAAGLVLMVSLGFYWRVDVRQHRSLARLVTPTAERPM
jgi:hypothetical protein